ncbi:MAG: diaminopimelate epimerase [Planctomycetaceae bacterium]|nr:diaminopimelate epimerase [Planctomycetaceae bacterium]
MRFTKMHGAGNDYVYVSLWDESLPEDIPALARRVSHRHFGIGSDGLILIGPSNIADARMQMFNADGSPGLMCGNGLRCVARWLHDHRGLHGNPLRIETARGVVEATLEWDGTRVKSVRVNMGRPGLAPADIPVILNGNDAREPLVDVPLEIEGQDVRVTLVSMGNPHAIVFVESCDEGELVRTLGPRIERHPAFPDRTNVEFVQVISRSELRMRVWERGAGETLACGTGACAAVVGGTLRGLLERRAAVHLPGGTLEIEWTSAGDVLMAGPAVEVFRGDFPLMDVDPMLAGTL